jgi:hypothetical protein
MANTSEFMETGERMYDALKDAARTRMMLDETSTQDI